MQTDFTSGQQHDITPDTSFSGYASTIRLISATPSDSGRSSIDALPPMLNAAEDPWEAAGLTAPLAPKSSITDAERKKRLVPKKSKIGLLAGSVSGKNKSQDFSDVVRRVGAPPQSSSSFGGGFEIYVDSRPKSPEQEEDEDIAEVVVVRKKKSRMALDGVAWGGPLNEVTNVPAASALEVSRKKSSTLSKKKKEKESKEKEKENEGGRGSTSGGLVKMKSEMDAKDKWWSIGRGSRGRKELNDVKEELREETKEKKKRAKSPGPEEATKVKSKSKSKDPVPRSKTPDPLRRAQSSVPEKTLRSRFHSMDFGMMFKSANESAEADTSLAPSTSSPSTEEPITTESQLPEEQTTPKASSTSRKTKTSGGHQRQGSIAVRAMKSFQSLARMGSWNQLKRANMEDYAGDETEVENVQDTPKEKKVKKEKKVQEDDAEVKDKEKKSKKSSKESKDKDKSSKSSKSTSSSSKKKKSMDILSSSAFEPPQQDDDTVLGAAFEYNPPAPETKDPSLGKKRSILGIGLPSTLSKMTGRLQHTRSGSTASSVFAAGSDGEPRQPATLSGRTSRLSLSSARMLFTHGRSSSRAAFDSSMISRERSSSVMSNHTGGSKGSTRSSLRPPSITSSILARAGLDGDRRSSGGSVRWDESVLESVRERRDKERVDTEKMEKVEKPVEKSEKERLKEEKEKRREERAQKREEKEKRRVEKEKRKEEKEKKKAEKEKKRAEAESGTKKSKKDSKSSESKSKRTAVTDIFPDTESSAPAIPELMLTPTQQLFDRAPVIRKKAATSDGYPMNDTDSVIGSIMEQAIKEEDFNEATLAPTNLGTPTKKARRRPMSEQLLGRGRPVALSDESGEVVFSMLDAATNDLAQLISNLDLEATPGTPDRTPNKITRTFKLDFNAPPVPRRDESPIRRSSAGASVSAPLEEAAPTSGPLKRAPSYLKDIPSIRPYAQSRKNTIGHSSRPSQSGIPAWPVPESEEQASQSTARSHSLSSPPSLIIGAMTSPLLPAAEITPSQVFFPPPSATSEKSSTLRAKAFSTSDEGTIKALSKTQPRASLANIFTRPESSASSEDDFIRRSPVFRRPGSMSDSSARNSSQYNDSHRSEPSSFMGDIPAELHDMLVSQNADDALSFFDRASIISPADDVPMLPGSSLANSMIPLDPSILNAEPIDFTGEEVDETKRSFDFTAEIRNLRESSVFEHQSFVEQLENAFGTPPKVNYTKSRDESDAPTLPEIPSFLKPSPPEVDDASSFCHTDETGSSQFHHGDLMDLNMMAAQDSPRSHNSQLPFGMSSWSSGAQFGNPTLFPDTASFAGTEHSEDVIMDDVSNDEHESRGQLNMSFRFGGLPKVIEPVAASPGTNDHPKSLADIIPPLSHASTMGSALPVPISPAPSAVPRRRVRVSSDSSIHRLSTALSLSPEYRPEYRHSRANSELSFMGLESFDAVRRNFEFGRGQPRFWPPVADNQGRFLRPQSMFSVASVSSYGRPHDYGLSDPFGYGSLSFNERPMSDAFSILSNTVDDTFDFIHRRPQRRRVDSDASSFYFRAPHPGPTANRDSRRFSALSLAGHAPPVSLVTRGLSGRRRNDSAASIQSRGRPFSGYGTTSKRFSWTRHRRDSGDSAMSDFSISRIIRPGLGDKMFDTAANYRMSLASIPASPKCAGELPSIMDRSFQDDTDSIVDHDESRFQRDDSIFSRLGDNLTSHSVGSAAAERSAHVRFDFRPMSVVSDQSRPSPIKESDLSVVESSPIGHGATTSSPSPSPSVRIEKRKRSEDVEDDKALEVPSNTPNKARIIEEPVVVSASPYAFGEDRMVQAQQGQIRRYSLEESCLEAKGEDSSVPYYNAPIFSRPGVINRSRSSTCTSASESGRETPSLTSAGSDSFSSMDMDEGSSVDLSDLNLALHTAHSHVRIRTRSRPTHSRQSSYARTTRSSIYETIEEEIMGTSASPTKTGLLGSESVTFANSTTTRRPVFLTVDDDAVSIRSARSTRSIRSRVSSVWEDDTGVIALRKYYALKNEAESAVSDSRRQWSDTQGSTSALRAFQPPKQPSEMRALLEESLQTFQPLASELRPLRVRSRTSSRVSPYPASKPTKVATEELEAVPPMPAVFSKPAPQRKKFLKDVTTQSNLSVQVQVPLTDGPKLFPTASSSDLKREPVFRRPRVPSGGPMQPATPHAAEHKSIARVASREFKENVALGTLTPGDALKFRRPRPRGRTTNGSLSGKPIRI